MIFVFNVFSTSDVFAQDLLNLDAEAAILVDAESGKILYQKNPDELLPPASMTKMMTMYLVMEAIKEGKITWDQKTQPSDYSHTISQKRNLSNVPLRRDGQYNVRELFEATIIYSANGAAITLAELIAGSEGNFVKMMNEKAAQLGLKNYKFVNATGLNNSDLAGMHPEGTEPDAENMISARSCALLGYRLLKDYPDVLQISSIPKKTFREGTEDAIKMDNWNWMLPSLVFAYEGIDGLKTGSSPTAGFSFTGTAKRNGMRVISVIMKAPSYQKRFSETRKLMDYGFANFTKKEVVPANYQVAGQSEVPVIKGKEKTVKIAGKKPIVVLLKRGEEKQYEPYVQLDNTKLEEGALVAPLKKGEKVGTLALKYKGELKYGFLTNEGLKTEQTEAVTTTEVKKANFIVLFFRWIIVLIKGAISSI